MTSLSLDLVPDPPHASSAYHGTSLSLTLGKEQLQDRDPTLLASRTPCMVGFWKVAQEGCPYGDSVNR